jgi:hypothetical protein
MIAWVVLFIVIIGCIVATQLLRYRMPAWVYVSSVVLLALVIGLDLWSIWDLRNVGAYASASVTATMALLLFLTIRELGQILAAAALFGLALIVAIGLSTPLTPETLPAQIAAIGFAVLPVLVGIYVAGGFRTVVSSELERVLAQSTLKSPRLSVGFLASEELARLDFAAEQLLMSVANGTIKLPLSRETADTAATIATNLRFQLLEQRHETWLHHAITESAQLKRSVRLRDASGLAGLLGPTQRQSLLAALWLFGSYTDRSHTVPSLEIIIESTPLPLPTLPSNMLVINISLIVDGISRNHVDLSIWDSIRKVGKFRDAIHNDRLRIDMDCTVENPVEK